MVVVVQQVESVGVLIIVLLKVVHLVHQKVVHMAYMPHILVLMSVIRVVVEHVNV